MALHQILTGSTIHNRLDVVHVARKGIETRFLESILKYTAISESEMAEILPISKRQLMRYAPDHLLNKEITSHLIQIIELYEKGYLLFGEEKFQRWMRTPNRVLQRNEPIALLDTGLGIEMIEDIIGRIEHGVYS